MRSFAVENDRTALAIFAHETAILEVRDQGILEEEEEEEEEEEA